MENLMLTQRRGDSDKKTPQQKLKEIKLYLQNRVMPLLSPLQIDILKQRPQNITQFCIDYLKKSKHTQNDNLPLKENQSDQIPQELFRQRLRQKLHNKPRSSRKGIMGDRPKQGFLNIGNHYLSTPGKEWPEQVTVNLLMHLKKCVFFEHLQTSELIKLIQRMHSLSFNAGDVIIREGDSGNQLYIVDSGVIKCEKKGHEGILKMYNKGQIFGQLSLLYNNPRASTLTAIEDGRLFALPRPQFAAVLHMGMMIKLRQCEQLVDKVDLFDTLNLYQKSKLYENMQQKVVGPEKFIIREGEEGSCFYIVAQGQLAAYKQKDGENKLVYAYKKGDYFGQIALLKNLPRQASVKTLTEVRLYFINTQCFSRILGPLQIILKRNQERYSRLAAHLSK